MERRCWSRARSLLLLLAVAWSACGGSDMDVLLELEPGPCWQAGAVVNSFSVFVAVERRRGDAEVLVPVSRECVDPPQPVPLTPEGLRGAFAPRGFVATGVHADERTWIVIHLHPQGGCDSLPPVCLISEDIPPDGELDRVKLLATCPPAGQPSPPWLRCTQVAQNPP